MQNVTVPHAKFRTELVVNLYSGWIVQLVNASFAWRTHNLPEKLEAKTLRTYFPRIVVTRFLDLAGVVLNTAA
jgi:hypothetical protein